MIPDNLVGDILAALALVLAAWIAYRGVKYTARQSRTASERAERLEEKAIDAQAYTRARESYEASITNYLREIARLEARLSSLNSRISGLNAEVLALEEFKRTHQINLDNMIDEVNKVKDELLAARTEYEDHLRRCQYRLQRLRHRLSHGDIISEDDPDLQLEP